MGSQSRWGLTLPLSGLPLAAQQDLVTGLPGLGYTDVWSAELNGIDGFTPLILASQWAPQLRLGTAIVGIYTRAPVSLAVQAGTLAALAPGKFVMGIGTSSQVAVEQWNGIAFEKPYQRSPWRRCGPACSGSLPPRPARRSPTGSPPRTCRGCAPRPVRTANWSP